ncbi:hypothetical protein Tco_1118556 [Tanacetum coccineum]
MKPIVFNLNSMTKKENPTYAKPKEGFGIRVFMASLASVFKDPGNEEKDGLVSLDNAMVPLPPSLEYIIWSGVTANDKKRLLVVVVLGGLFEIRNHIVDAFVIARILEALLVLPVLNGDERIRLGNSRVGQENKGANENLQERR